MVSKNKSFEEKVEIVKELLEEGLSYKEAATKHGVSYNNVYSWVKKYKEYGEKGLIDGRGRGRPDDVLSETELLERQLKEVRDKQSSLVMELDTIKALEEAGEEIKKNFYPG